VSKQGCVPLGYSLDHIGPMARTARDCALMLQVMAGSDLLDPTTATVPVPDYVASLTGTAEGVRIGVPREFFFDHPDLDEEVREAALRSIDVLSAAGAIVKDVVLPHAAISRTAQRVIMLGEAYAYHKTDLQRRPEAYGKHTRRTLLEGALFSAADYVQAQRVRSIIKQEALEALSDLDVLVTPTLSTLAPVFDGTDPDSMRGSPSYTSIWNLTGQPAASVCCGFSESGLPVGLQIIGKPFDEATVLRVADAYQALTDWHTRTPAGVREVQPA
jgi:aspartyl-tRNA(Asn)/glutamyl-tRNA(Gln) amidotransferase subunit A